METRETLVKDYGEEKVAHYEDKVRRWCEDKDAQIPLYPNVRKWMERDGICTIKEKEVITFKPYSDDVDYTPFYDDAMRVLDYMNERDAKIYEDFPERGWTGHKEWRGIAHLIMNGETADELIDYIKWQWPTHTKLCRAVGLKLYRTRSSA